jgi:hypothetical protein
MNSVSTNWTTGLEGVAYPQVTAPPGFFSKYPVENFDVLIDWEAEGFLAAGDSIVSSSWSADVGITIGVTVMTATTTTVWVSGGTAGWLYHVTNTITTVGGRTFQRFIDFKIKTPR